MSMIADPVDEVHQRQAAAAGLRTFMRLPVGQPSSVILIDVLGYSQEEIAGITGSSIPAVKVALHRGRERLRAAAQEPELRRRSSARPAMRGSRPMWTASMRATSMP
jgi:RNA polymerase sigma-70 factor (ECF subfamily)